MTHTNTEQPEALQIAAWLRKSNDEAMAWREDGAAAIERLHSRVQELETQLIKEATRTAEQKLRADQMTLQHKAQSAMASEAREALAQQRKPLSDEAIDSLWGGAQVISVPQKINRRAIARSIERAHCITQEKHK